MIWVLQVEPSFTLGWYNGVVQNHYIWIIDLSQRVMIFLFHTSFFRVLCVAMVSYIVMCTTLYGYQQEILKDPLLTYPVIDIRTAEQCYAKGYELYKKEDFEKSILYLDQSITISKALNDLQLQSKAYRLKGHIYLMAGHDKNALEAYDIAIEIVKHTKDLEEELKINSGLILVLKKMGQLDKAVAISEKMLRDIYKTSFVNCENHVRIYTTINDVYLEKEMYDEVLTYADEGIEISRSIDFFTGELDLLIKKGMVYYYKGDYDTSLDYLQESQDILNNHNIDNKFFPTIRIHYFTASCYYQQQQYDKAIGYAHKSIEQLEEEDEIKEPVVQLYLLLANCYRAKKDFQKALYWNDAYIRIQKEYQQNKDQTVDKIYAKEAQQLESQIFSLKDQATKDQRSKTITVIILIIITVACILITVRYIKRQKSDKKVFDQLVKKIAQLESSKKNTSQHKETAKINLDDQKINDILARLEKLELQEYFLKPDCNLRDMAKKVKTNTAYLSNVISSHKANSFSDYINELRINYALKRLTEDKKFRSFSIKSIAMEIGYKSDNSFTKHFKAKTGLNPSYYIKSIEKKELTV